MLRLLQRLLGWDTHPEQTELESVERRQQARASTSAILAASPAPADDRTEKGPAGPELSLEDPESGRNRTKEVGIDPYDTGTFNRPDMWNPPKESSKR